MTATQIGFSYFGAAFNAERRDAVIDWAEQARQRMQFDTLVVTGISGVVMGGVLAHALGVNLLVVRKEDDRSTHSFSRIEGHLGERWAFLDDLIDTGSTRSRVVREVRALADRRDISTRFVGTVAYQDHLLFNGVHRPIHL